MPVHVHNMCKSITGQAGISWRGVVSTYFDFNFRTHKRKSLRMGWRLLFSTCDKPLRSHRSGTKYCIRRSWRHAPDLFCPQLSTRHNCRLLLLVDSPNFWDKSTCRLVGFAKHLVGLSWHLLPTPIVHSIPSSTCLHHTSSRARNVTQRASHLLSYLESNEKHTSCLAAHLYTK